jgi:hypothetical protein
MRKIIGRKLDKMMKHVWLRDEVKPFEKRSALTPEAAKILMDAGKLGFSLLTLFQDAK